MIYGQCTHVGQVRKSNEDFCFVSGQKDDIALAVVADGMGGHNAGDIASKMTVEIIVHKMLKNEQKKPPLLRIREAVEEANLKVYEYAQSNRECNGMGTTVTLALMSNKTAYVANVGDSRTYYYSAVDRIISRVTRDHSLVEELISSGKLLQDQAKAYVFRNVITRAIGAGKTVNVDLFDADWQKGDMLLLCSDGMTAHIDDDELPELMQLGLAPQALCELLLSLVLERGGKDNVTIVIVLNENDAAFEKGGDSR